MKRCIHERRERHEKFFRIFACRVSNLERAFVLRLRKFFYLFEKNIRRLFVEEIVRRFPGDGRFKECRGSEVGCLPSQRFTGVKISEARTDGMQGSGFGQPALLMVNGNRQWKKAERYRDSGRVEVVSCSTLMKIESNEDFYLRADS